jgi:hypothetical protein
LGDPSALPVPGAPNPAGPGEDAGTGLSPGPVSSRGVVRVVPAPEFSPVVGEMLDAGNADSYAPPMVPLPDGSVPADSRLEPKELLW